MDWREDMKILYLPNQYSQQRQHEKPSNIYPVRMAMEAQWYREQGNEVSWNPKKGFMTDYDKVITEPENLPFLSLPKPDRIFTNAKAYDSGNYKYKPGTHILSASGCWWGKCSFCVENGQKYEVRPVESVIEEIEECKSLGFREIFDDSASFPTGYWLEKFCEKIKGNKTPLGCNMRTVNIDYKAMKEAGFRMVLFGIESINPYTLKKINKGVEPYDIKKYIKQSHDAGLEPHICVMFGWPWETDKDAERTLSLVHYLLKKGYAKTAQASFYTDWSNKSTPNESQRKYVSKIYDVWKSPQFWFNQLKDIKNTDDIKYLWLKIKTAMKG